MRVRTWKILDWGDVPPNTRTTIPYACRCGYEAELPVRGRVVAIVGCSEEEGDGAIVFDPIDPPGRIPADVQCRRCGRVLTTKPEPANVR